MRWVIGLCLGVCSACGGGEPAPLLDASGGLDGGDAAVPVDGGGDPDAGLGGDASDAGATARCAPIGVEVGTQTRVFRGIRYADAPRWAPPRRLTCDSAPAADTFGPACPQLDPSGAPIGEEECLFLNVWAPRDAIDRPVLVFIHGGGNAQGSATQTVGQDMIYDGLFLSEGQDAVVVTINYRLGPLGWLFDGNFGLRDQLAALEWVRDHIGDLGGDASRVAIFGESAGARNVCMLIASPGARGLFSAAMMQSGGCSAVTSAAIAAETQAQLDASGCADIECLKQKTPAELLLDNPPVISVAGRSSQMQPMIDGDLLPDAPLAIIGRGEHNHAAVIVGANSDETSQSVPMIPSEAVYMQLINAQFGTALGAQVLARYPASAFASPEAAYIAVTSDAKFICGARRDARAIAGAQSEPVYRYFFTQNLSRAPRLRDRGAYHGLDLFFVFDHLRFSGYQPSSEEDALADTMGEYWASLPRDGSLSAEWPRYDVATDRTMILDGTNLGPTDGIRTARCDFWQSIGL